MRLKVLPEGAELLYNVPTSAPEGMTTAQEPQKLLSLPEGSELLYNIPQSRQDRQIEPVEKPLMAKQNMSSKESSVVKEPSLLTSFIDDVSQDLEKRAKEVEQTAKDYKDGKISFVEAELQTLGKGVAGSIIDVGGEVIGTLAEGAGKGIQYMMPETSAEIVEMTKSGLDFLLNTELGKMGTEAILDGVESWEGFKAENPRAAKNIESVVNIGTILAPVKVKANAKPKADPSKLQKAADDLREAQLAKEMPKREAFALKLSEPKLTEDELAARARRTTQESGILRKNVYEPTARETLIAKEFAKLPIDKGYSFQKNLNIVDGEIGRLSLQLEKTLGTVKTTIDDISVQNKVDDAIDKLMTEKLTMVGDEATNKVLMTMATKIDRLWNESDKSPLGLLKVRQEFDSWAKANGAKWSNDVKVNNINEGSRALRNALNDVLEESVPDGKVKDSLMKQHLLFSGAENLAIKAGKEGTNVITRLWNNVANLAPFKSETNRVIGAGLGLPIGVAAHAMAPALGVAIIGGSTAYLLSKGIMKATSKKSLALLLEQTDKALKIAKNPDMIKQLRADRLAIVEILKNVKVVPDSYGEGQEEEQEAGITIPIPY